jgi:hypothetical protein
MSKETNKKPAKLCYNHIGGKLGTLLLEKFVENGWLTKDNQSDKHFYITEKGNVEFGKLGIDISQIKDEKL